MADQAYHILEGMLITLRLKPGAVISESRLAVHLGIGRTPIREALQRLAFEGLVVIMPRRGIMVSEINVAKQLSVLEIRREIERLIARTAAIRANTDERRHFLQIAQQLERAAAEKDNAAFMRYDREFDTICGQCCQNPFASGSLRLTQGLSRRFWFKHHRIEDDLPACARHHKNVAQAIANGNAEKAAQCSDALIDFIEKFSRATL